MHMYTDHICLVISAISRQLAINRSETKAHNRKEIKEQSYGEKKRLKLDKINLPSSIDGNDLNTKY